MKTKPMVVLRVNPDGTVLCYHDGEEINAHTNLGLDNIPLNGIAYVQDNEIVAWEKEEPFQSFLTVHGGN